AGDALVTLALAGSLFFNISLHAARGRVALSLVLTMAPFAIVAPFLGPIIDRTQGGRRVMVLVSAIGRAFACLFMARYIHGLLLFPAAFVTLVCSKGYIVAKAALVPTAVRRPEDLVEANSKLAISGALIGFVAAGPGVAILKLFGAATLLRVDIALFVACALSSLRLYQPLPSRAQPSEAQPSQPSSPPPTVPRRGRATAVPAPGEIQIAAVAIGALRAAVGFLTFLVAFGFRRTSAPAWWYGAVLAASVGGNLVGAAMAPRLRARFREEWIIAGSVAMVAATGLIAMQIDGLHRRPSAALLAGAIGFTAAAAKLAFDSLVQREVPAAAQGRAFGRFEAGFQLVWVLGGLVPVVISMSLRVGFILVTSASVLAVIIHLVGTRLATVGQLPRWWPGTPNHHGGRRPLPGPVD
ncbi:MAG TPA: MFS transporter, partial [Acidimicrobiales bacterium]